MSGRAGLRPAVWPRADAAGARLLHVDPRAGSVRDAWLRDLPGLLRPGDLLVVNDVATLPAALTGRTRLGPVEVRLAGPPDEDRRLWPAVLFGPGSWRRRTEDRPPPPRLDAGEPILFGELEAEVVAVSALSPRLVDLAFDRPEEALWPALYREGRPIQYSHLCGPLSPWHVQTPYAARPWAVEMPSAGWALRLPLLRQLRRRSVIVAAVSHAAGLSSTGDPALDAALPLPERTEIPPATALAIERARAAGGRVVAAGTTVARALEGRAIEGGPTLRHGSGTTRLRLGPGHSRRVVDGLLTGLHAPGESHFELVQVFAPRALLERALRRAAAGGYSAHEFGDLSLILAA